MNYSRYSQKTTHAARGKWRGILQHFGVSEKYLTGRHSPCPVADCGGEDRFRFDNKEGNGTFICSHCGAGDGMQLVMNVTGMCFPDAAAAIDKIVGNVKTEPPSTVKKDVSQEERIALLRRAYAESARVVPGDLADKYLRSRGVGQSSYPDVLRLHKSMNDGEGGVRPCLLAMVGRSGQRKFETMHRTFLKPDGSGKAEMRNPRKLMPGAVPEGSCVMLSAYSGGALGIAEGIETALSASMLYDMPVWAAISAPMLLKWQPPEGCEEVAIFGDNDANYTGHYAAYSLAYRLSSSKNMDVTVHMPESVGCDWNDVHARRTRSRSAQPP